ncbi:MAG: hypothetical protein GY862_07755 [Gammaproteobacteria bacterium]|nr:hypothetical protein [Gammaproteobacteria bacterium]
MKREKPAPKKVAKLRKLVQQIPVAAYEELLANHERLEELVQKRTREVEKAYAQLQAEVAERKKAEALERKHMRQLAHASRLSMMGELATQIAHELNQPLAAIATYSGACIRLLNQEQEKRPEEYPDLLAALQEVGGEAQRAGKIIRQLRRLVSYEEIHQTALDINGLIREVVHLVEVEAQWHSVTLQLAFADGLPPVIADRILIEQLILNLTHNAIEAMDNIAADKRVLKIRTASVGADEIEVAVADNGPGLSPMAMNQVFDCFYTTKSNGIGLGLSVSQSIVKIHHGRLWVDENVQEGTTFRFAIPINAAGDNNNEK